MVLYSANKLIDMRNETLEERKIRIKTQKIIRYRSKQHAMWVFESGGLEVLAVYLDSESELTRSRASAIISRLVSATDDESTLKDRLSLYVCNASSPPYASHSPSSAGGEQEYKEDISAVPPPPSCRRRAWMEACLLITKPDIGVWALQQPGGIRQLLMLSATSDVRNQEAASEVFCLSASVEAAESLLAPVVSSGVLQLLLDSPAADVRTSAASTLTKLSLKAKALNADSSETTQALSVSLFVLKNALLNQASEDKEINSSSSSQSKTSSGGLARAPITNVSFSALDFTASATSASANTPGHGTALSGGSPHWTTTKSPKELCSIERAIEVIATLVGKTSMKEELVHGSHR